MTDQVDAEEAGTQSLLGEMIFGQFDGLTSVIGVIAAGLAAHARLATVAASAAGLAVAATVSMAGGEYLGDIALKGRRGRALAMGSSTLVGSLLPALPYLWASRNVATGISAGIVAVLLAIIITVRTRGEIVRGRGDPAALWWSSTWQTVTTLILAAGLAIAVAYLLGAG